MLLLVSTMGIIAGLNESPSEKEGKLGSGAVAGSGSRGLNESPSEKEGKSAALWPRVPATWLPQ